MGGQTNNGQLPKFGSNEQQFINAKRMQKRIAFEKQQQPPFQQADEFSSLPANNGQDLNIIAGDDYFTQMAKKRAAEQAKLTAEQRALQSSRGAGQQFAAEQNRNRADDNLGNIPVLDPGLALDENDPLIMVKKIKRSLDQARISAVQTQRIADPFDLLEPPLSKPNLPNRGGLQSAVDSPVVEKMTNGLGALSAPINAGDQLKINNDIATKQKRIFEKTSPQLESDPVILEKQSVRDRAAKNAEQDIRDAVLDDETKSYIKNNTKEVASLRLARKIKQKYPSMDRGDAMMRARQIYDDQKQLSYKPPVNQNRSVNYMRVEKAFKAEAVKFESALKTEKEKQQFRAVMNGNALEILIKADKTGFRKYTLEQLEKFKLRVTGSNSVILADKIYDKFQNGAMATLKKQIFSKPVDFSFYYQNGTDGVSLYDEDVEKVAIELFDVWPKVAGNTMQEARRQSRFIVDGRIKTAAENRRQLNNEALENLLNSAKGKTGDKWQTALQGLKLLIELSPVGPAIDLVENVMIAVEANKNGDSKAMYIAIAAAGFSALEFIPVVRLLSKGGRLAKIAMKSMTAAKKSQKLFEIAGLTGPAVTSMIFNRNAKIGGEFLKRIAKGASAPQAIGTAIISEYMTTVTKVLIKKKLFNKNFTPELLTELYGSKLFFMAEIKTRFPQIFEGMSDQAIKKAYDAAIGMAFDKLKTRDKKKIVIS